MSTARDITRLVKTLADKTRIELTHQANATPTPAIPELPKSVRKDIDALSRTLTHLRTTLISLGFKMTVMEGAVEAPTYLTAPSHRIPRTYTYSLVPSPDPVRIVTERLTTTCQNDRLAVTKPITDKIRALDALVESTEIDLACSATSGHIRAVFARFQNALDGLTR